MLFGLGMPGGRIGWRVLIGVVILGAGASLSGAAEVGIVPASCPGYVAHLRNARAHLTHGNRLAAAAELREAQRALESCARSDATSEGVAASSAFSSRG